MIVAVISDTHDDLDATLLAVEKAIGRGAEVLVHCGDIASPPILSICCQLPCYFTFGNHDSDAVAELLVAAQEHGAYCLDWGGEIELAGKRVAVTHGHMTSDLRPLLESEPDYLLSGHFHEQSDRRVGKTRRVCPGALYRAEPRTFALIDLGTDSVEFVALP